MLHTEKQEVSSVTKQYMDLTEYNKNYHENLLEVYM